MKKYYEILEVNQNASLEIIEKAYRVLARKYHPDLYDGEDKKEAEKKMRDINEAYKILSDDFLREQYNSELQREKEERENKLYKNEYKHNKFNIKRNKNNEHEDIIQKNDIGTYKGILDVTKAVFQNRPKINIKDFKREDYIAIGLTAVIIVVLLIILWFIPATNGFVKSMLPFLK